MIKTGRTISSYRDEQGQALILAVLIMLVLAALAGVFIALIGSNLAQIARQSDIIVLENIAESGIRYADQQLTYGLEGADWRPDPNPSDYDYGNGHFRLTVSYNPTANSPISKYIIIRSEARLFDEYGNINPFLRRTVVAYKPILLTDYARFVTNRERSGVAAAFGPPLEVFGEYYKTCVDGPVRANTDLVWYGGTQIRLESPGSQFLRDDRVEVSGRIIHDTVPVNGILALINGVSNYPKSSEDSQFSTLDGFYRDGFRAMDGSGNPRWVRYLDPPRIDLADPATGRSRYVELTANSGEWKYDTVRGKWINTGWYGYGEGLYLDNYGDIQFGHDYQLLRNDWVNPPSPDLYVPDSGWDEGRLSYSRVPGVEIELFPEEGGGLSVPYIQLTRHDGRSWWEWDNANQTLKELSSPTIRLPYPQNGVIYAAGNIRIKGSLPEREGSPSGYYDQSPYDFDNSNWPSTITDTSRHYNLTVVSGATIYIEGNLLSPNPGDESTNSKLALLARDSVCLNTPQFLAVSPEANIESETFAGQSEFFYEISAGRSLDFSFATATANPSNVKLYLRHSGYGTDWTSSCTMMNLLVYNNQYASPLYDWGDGTDYYFSTLWFRTTYLSGLADSNWSSALWPLWEYLPNSDTGMGINLDGAGLANWFRFQLNAASQNNYLVSKLALQGIDAPGTSSPLAIEIDAMIYAQNGSWFIIPGEWFNENDTPTAQQIALGCPEQNEPLDIQIVVNGTIAENRTAPVGDLAKWVVHWRGANERYQAWDQTLTNADQTNPGLRYIFDPALRTRLSGSDSLPRLPKLPVSPILIAWGERI